MKKISPIQSPTYSFDAIERNTSFENHLKFQDLLISISATYINADLSDIDTLINSSLNQMGKFVEADRSYIFSYDFEDETTSNTYEWCSDGTEPEIDNLQKVPLSLIKHWVNQHKKGEALYVKEVEKLLEKGDKDLYDVLQPQGIKSIITIPILKNDNLIGFVGFDSVTKHHNYTDNEKNLLFVFANMLVNIMQRKENELLIKEQEQKKEELLKSLSLQNEQLNEYAHVVSHDLKAPLINIHNLIDWFIADHKENFTDFQLTQLKEVLFNVEKMDVLIKGILDYSTVDRLDKDDRNLNCNDLIDDVLTIISVPENIEITIQENLPTVFGNAWRFKQVFQNLIQNAIKYNDKENGFIEVGCIEKEDEYEFFVKDNGLGIHPNYHERIFKVFTKLNSESVSSGIGLSIVKKIVTFYNGKIWLDSEENKGTTFFFTIPK